MLHSQHNQIKKQTEIKFFVWLCCEYLQCVSLFGCVVSICSAFLYLVVLWVFAVRFFIWLCCEHLQHLLSNWWRCFLDLHVFSEVAAHWALSATVKKTFICCNSHLPPPLFWWSLINRMVTIILLLSCSVFANSKCSPFLVFVNCKLVRI